MALTLAQVEILDDFFESDLLDGSLAFEWDHPRTTVTYDFAFLDPPHYIQTSYNAFDAAIELETVS